MLGHHDGRGVVVVYKYPSSLPLGMLLLEHFPSMPLQHRTPQSPAVRTDFTHSCVFFCGEVNSPVDYGTFKWCPTVTSVYLEYISLS